MIDTQAQPHEKARRLTVADFRCTNCGKLLFRARLTTAYIEARCPRCGYLVVFDIQPVIVAAPVIVTVTDREE